MGIPISRLDELGFVYDKKGFTLPPNAWSDARNVRFIDGSVYPSYGHQAVLGIPNVAAYYLHATLDVTLLPIFAYCGLAQIWATDGTTHSNITRAAGGNYTGTDADLWQAFNFGGISIFNNGVDKPQAWIGRQLSQQVVDLANWPANTAARIIRGYRRFLFAFDVAKSGVRYPQLAKWSHEADPGAVPSTWDETDETKDAGEYPLVDTEGPIVDALALSDSFLIYKTDAVYSAKYIGGTFIFDLPLAFRGFGALSQRCIGEWRKKHVVLYEDNIFLNDGFQFASLLQARTRRWLASRIDSTNAFRSFIVINEAEDEAWICFPENGNTFPNVALIVNLNTGAGVPKDLPNVSHIEYGKSAAAGGTSFDAQNIEFDSMVGYFGQSTNSLTKKRLLGCAPKAARNYLLRSDEASDAAWTKTALTITANTLADPITAAVTMDRMVPSVANTTHFMEQTRAKIQAASVSAYLECVVRAAGYSFIRLAIDDGTSGNRSEGYFDLTNSLTGNVSSTGTFSGAQATIENLSGGYYRCRIQANTGSEANIRAVVFVATALGTSSFAGDGTSGVDIGRMQIREGAISTVYQQTTSVGATSAFYLFDSSYYADGVGFNFYVERLGLAVSGQNRDGSPRIDPTVKKLFQELWPKVELLAGSGITIQAGGQELADASILWRAAQVFNPATDLFIPVDLECRYEAVRFEGSSGNFWRFTEYDITLAPIGTF